MAQAPLQRAFATMKAHVPPWISGPIRGVTAAALTPALFSYHSGHFRSCLKRLAVYKDGEPIPWYSYPCIEFLRHRPFRDKTILEFGGGQSTLWWAERAHKVVTFEGDKGWLDKLAGQVPSNVELHHVTQADRTACVAGVEAVLQRRPGFLHDVVVIDGLWRYELIEVAVRALADDGMIICDDADGYGFHGGFMGRDLNRVDFYGQVPGGAFPHVTSIYFPSTSFGFSPNHPIRAAAFQ